MKITELYTRSASDEGVRVEVLGPDQKPTGIFITVRGQDSAAFQSGNRVLRRNLMKWLEENGSDKREGEAYHEFVESEQRRLQATLVKDWTFEEECTESNVIELFTQAPYIAVQVEDAAGKRERYASTSSKPCEPTPRSESDGPSQSQADHE